MARDLSERDFVYIWVDGVHFNVRLEDTRLCCLVIVGVRLDGTKELVAITDGYRTAGSQSSSWARSRAFLARSSIGGPLAEHDNVR